MNEKKSDTMSEAQALFEEDVAAYLAVREQEAAATTVEIETLHIASIQAREDRLSVRAAASELRVSHAKVSRHQQERGVPSRDMWGGRHRTIRLGHQCLSVPRHQGGDLLRRSRDLVLVNDAAGEWRSRVETFLRARTRAEALRHERSRVLRMALVDGKEGLGLSVRAVAARLGVPHATAARAYLSDQVEPPVWADEESLLEARRLAWAHAPHRPEFQEDRVPYEWTDHPDGSRSVRLIPVGVARLRREEK